jgi:hypothetical protein
MEVVSVGPLVSPPAAATGVLWSQSVQHPSLVPAVRVHVQVRRARAAADWRLRVRDLSGGEVETVAGGSPLLASGEFWTREVRGRGAEIVLESDTDAAGLEVAIDRYAFRVISPIPKSITGIDQRQPVGRAPEEVRGWSAPVARLVFVVGNRQFTCTGFLVTGDLLLTNEHCLGTAPVALSALVEFGFDSLDSTPETFRVSRLEAVSAPLDYSVVRLTQAPPPRYGRVAFGAAAAAENQALVVIQHPAGEFKQVSIADCRVSGAVRPGVAAGPTDFGHLCDTLGGSSGSPVVDRQTGRVLGLHHWGFLPDSDTPVNQAVQIGLVLEDLRTRAPALHAEIVGGNP